MLDSALEERLECIMFTGLCHPLLSELEDLLNVTCLAAHVRYLILQLLVECQAPEALRIIFQLRQTSQSCTRSAAERATYRDHTHDA